MKKLLMITTVSVFVWTIMILAALTRVCYAELKDDIVPGDSIDKVLKSENGVHVKRYGVRHIVDAEKIERVGIYKIVIGDLDKLTEIYWENRSRGFQGVLVYPQKINSNWTISEFKHRTYRGEPMDDRKLSEVVAEKSVLPRPLNLMPTDLLELVEMSMIYKKRGGIMVIYILPETSLEDVGKIFGFVVKYGGLNV